ncbi:uncharacterized protein LOC124890094 [Capsicum annuum]|uniref:uncharacterized protein LOC107877753 n=1 Tax=Capsicum annuum TaxID=4072 RepID=UPI001FB13D10|nr:uncharacterized protein LOC107877753 [Capsicum annuum]XP_047257919.1 uncharacterized protein LOC124890094 [Capsicum annuum]
MGLPLHKLSCGLVIPEPFKQDSLGLLGFKEFEGEGLLLSFFSKSVAQAQGWSLIKTDPTAETKFSPLPFYTHKTRNQTIPSFSRHPPFLSLPLSKTKNTATTGLLPRTTTNSTAPPSTPAKPQISVAPPTSNPTSPLPRLSRKDLRQPPPAALPPHRTLQRTDQSPKRLTSRCRYYSQPKFCRKVVIIIGTPSQVTVDDGSTCDVVGSGTIKATSSITLSCVKFTEIALQSNFCDAIPPFLVILVSTGQLLHLQHLFQQDHQLFKFIRGDERTTIHYQYQFICHQTILHLIL